MSEGLRAREELGRTHEELASTLSGAGFRFGGGIRPGPSGIWVTVLGPEAVWFARVAVGHIFFPPEERDRAALIEMIRDLITQDQLDVRWVAEGVTVSYPLPDPSLRRGWIERLLTGRDPGFHRTYPDIEAPMRRREERRRAAREREERAFRARLRLFLAPDGRVAGEIVTPEPLGPEEIHEHGVLTPKEYLDGKHITMSVFFQDGATRAYPGIRVSAPHKGRWRQMVERPFDLTAGTEERALVEKLVSQDHMDVHWVNEDVTVTAHWFPAFTDGWEATLSALRDVSRREFVNQLVALRHDFSEWPGGSRPKKLNVRRTARTPAQPLPFFAPRSGAVPRAGRATLADLRLPAGIRRPSSTPAYWITEHPVDNAADLAGQLAAAFAQTGLWPLLWLADDDPDAYIEQPGTADLVDDLPSDTLEHYLRSPNTTPGETWPELTTAAPQPFARIPADRSARILLVPCNRPADAITVLGGLACETPGPVISAVLRSWEQRVAAVPVALEPSHAWIAIESPPHDHVHALTLANELDAFCPLPPEAGLPDPEGLAERLISNDNDEPPDGFDFDQSRHLWTIGWYD